ncbi:MAG: lipid-binding SYLF domain-containing protein [Planctomycetota bacterium]|nr:lipid-binding SYLF domain-containing protein [Planctomycetota bacterium]
MIGTTAARNGTRAALLGALLLSLLSGCESDMTGVISKDVAAFRRIEQSKNPVPADVLAQARAVAIFSSTQAGVILGGKGGVGVFMKRLDDGFSPPLAIDLIEGSVGLQIGAQNEDSVYIFKTDAAVERFLTNGRYAVAQAAGSFGQGSGSTHPVDVSRNDVVVYTDAQGVYGGLVVGGSGFKIDEALNRKTYGQDVTTDMIVNGEVTPPPGTLVLWKLIKTEESGDALHATGSDD